MSVMTYPRLSMPDNKQDVAADQITQDVVSFFKDGFKWRTNVSLDYYMVDYDIKEFLADKIGCSGWDDLNENEKSKVFRNYPGKTLPNWNKLIKEGY